MVKLNHQLGSFILHTHGSLAAAEALRKLLDRGREGYLVHWECVHKGKLTPFHHSKLSSHTHICPL